RIGARIGEVVVDGDVVRGLKRDVGGGKRAGDRAWIDVRTADPVRAATDDIYVGRIEQPGAGNALCRGRVDFRIACNMKLLAGGFDNPAVPAFSPALGASIARERRLSVGPDRNLPAIALRDRV